MYKCLIIGIFVLIGNYYGMPKPPKANSSSLKSDTDRNSDIKPGAHPSSKGKRQRNRSTIEATSNKYVK